MTDFEFGFLSIIGNMVNGIWNALSKIVIFGMPFNVALVSALAISTILPFFLHFLSSGTGHVLSGSKSMYERYSRQIDLNNAQQRKRNARRNAKLKDLE